MSLRELIADMIQYETAPITIVRTKNNTIFVVRLKLFIIWNRFILLTPSMGSSMSFYWNVWCFASVFHKSTFLKTWFFRSDVEKLISFGKLCGYLSENPSVFFHFVVYYLILLCYD